MTNAYVASYNIYAYDGVRLGLTSDEVYIRVHYLLENIIVIIINISLLIYFI